LQSTVEELPQGRRMHPKYLQLFNLPSEAAHRVPLGAGTYRALIRLASLGQHHLARKLLILRRRAARAFEGQ
jgi:hypothetical protein